MNAAEKKKCVELESELTFLLGKESYEPYTRYCTGKWAGTQDHGLRFNDGSAIFISNGKKRYLSKLEEVVGGYRHFHENKKAIEAQLMQIVERDNRQACELGLTPIELLGLRLNTEPRDSYAFWIDAVFQKGEQLVFSYTETSLHYFARGFMQGFYEERLNRLDSNLRCQQDIAPDKTQVIVFGMVHEVFKGHCSLEHELTMKLLESQRKKNN